MKIFIAIKSAISRSLKLWKVALLLWFSSLLLVSIVALPMKGVLNSGFGKSMITEKLADGINIEVFADLGETFKSMVSYFSSGLIMLILACFTLNAFLTGGLFDSLKRSSPGFSGEEFFRSSAKNFWSFLIISLIISVIIIGLVIFVIVIPVSLTSQAEKPIEGAFFKTLSIVFPIFFLLLAILLLVADYARAWQVYNEKNRFFKAIGFGFSTTFRSFISSYPLMIIILCVQLFYGWLVLKILPGIKPVSGVGVFLLFLLSQFLFFFKVLLKIWRYGSVISLLEQTAYPPSPQMGG